MTASDPPRKSGRATLRDVAKAAGVSLMTVSNYVNAKTGSMSLETRQRVAKEIQRLNYRSDSAARDLRLSRRNSIGVIIVDDEPDFLSDPFTTHMLAGLSNTLSRAGYGMQVQGVGVETFAQSPIVNDVRTDGICVMLSGPPLVRRGIVAALQMASQPLVILQETFHFADADICLIRQADRDGGALVADAALKRGAKNLLALVPSCGWAGIEARTAGMRDRISNENAELRLLACGRADFAHTQAALRSEIAAHGVPDAILAGNDQMAIAAMKLLFASGLKVPDDVAVTGFNAFEFWQYTTPTLTTVRSQAALMGTAAGEQLLKRLETGVFATNEIVFPVTFQSGETC